MSKFEKKMLAELLADKPKKKERDQEDFQSALDSEIEKLESPQPTKAE